MNELIFEGHSGIYVKMIADSLHTDANPVDKGNTEVLGRISTLEMKYPRWIHSEFMTHRDRARNAASSRAVSTKKSFDNTVFRPFKIQSEKRGMQGGDEILEENVLSARQIIDDICNYTKWKCQCLVDLGVHKGIVNRYMEPFCHITVVCTSTFWNNFLELRNHPMAEQHFQELARLVDVCLKESKPEKRLYHLPYVHEDEVDWSENLMKVSAARSAAVSYLRAEMTKEKEISLCDKLITDKHSSPLEHPNSCVNTNMFDRYGCMKGWKSFRYIVGQGV